MFKISGQTRYSRQFRSFGSRQWFHPTIAGEGYASRAFRRFRWFASSPYSWVQPFPLILQFGLMSERPSQSRNQHLSRSISDDHFQRCYSDRAAEARSLDMKVRNSVVARIDRNFPVRPAMQSDHKHPIVQSVHYGNQITSFPNHLYQSSRSPFRAFGRGFAWLSGAALPLSRCAVPDRAGRCRAFPSY